MLIRRKKTLIILTICCAAAVIISGGLIFYFTQPAGRINASPVPVEELQLYVNNVRTDTINYFYTEYGADSNRSSFWSTQYGGITPREYALDAAKSQLLSDRILWEQAKEYGIDASVDYATKKQDLEQENKRRSNQLENDGVIYGTESYSMAQYLSYQRSELTDKLKTILLETDLKPTKKELMKAYEELDKNILDKGYKASIITYTCSEASLSLEVFTKIQALAAGGTPLSDIPGLIEKTYGNILIVDTYEVSPEIHREDTMLQSVYDLCRSMAVGEFTATDAFPNTLYYVAEKEDFGLMTYEEAGNYPTVKWINENFDAYIMDKAKSADIAWNKIGIKRIRTE